MFLFFKDYILCVICVLKNKIKNTESQTYFSYFYFFLNNKKVIKNCNQTNNPKFMTGWSYILAKFKIGLILAKVQD